MFRTIAQSVLVATPNVGTNAAYRFALVLLALSNPLLSIAQALVFVMFIEFTVGLNYIKNGAYTDKARKTKIAAFILVGINVLLIIVTGCLAVVLVSERNASYVHRGLVPHILRLERAYSAIFLIFGAATIAVAVAVKYMSKHVTEIRQVRSICLF